MIIMLYRWRAAWSLQTLGSVDLGVALEERGRSTFCLFMSFSANMDTLLRCNSRLLCSLDAEGVESV